ncbi:helix-turn-helix domain-containing protein [Chryseobacterium gambrini]|uniref:helix-turn-helix domain-containing protein n=1 Tax=Chryseobacterium gambrini TaxID=373672 RepID=UPI003D12BB5B
MIKNEKQYKISSKRKIELEESLSKILSTKLSEFDQIMVSALRSQIVTLEREISEFSKLVNEKPQVIFSKIEDLPKALIKARIIKGLTHNDMANLIGVREQQIQRYEAEEYSSAKFDRIIEIARMMDIRFDETKINIDKKLILKNTDSILIEKATRRLLSKKSFFELI